jgi:predicted nucleic acid-binding protein
MSALYFDASYVAKLRWQEPGAKEVRTRAAGADEIACCLHGQAEVLLVGVRKLREGSATQDEVRRVFAQFQADTAAGYLRWLPLSDAVVARIERVCESAPADLFLRAGDALHLACAAENGFTEAYSNDRHFLAAAPLFGLDGVNVIN